MALGCWAGLWDQIRVTPACSPGKTGPSMQWVRCFSYPDLLNVCMGVTGAAGALEEGWKGGVCAVHALSPDAFTSNTFLKGNKPSTRTEIALESTTRLAGGLELSRGTPPQQPVWWFPSIFLTDKRKLWKTHKDYCVPGARELVEVNCAWQHCVGLVGPGPGPGPATPLLPAWPGLAWPGPASPGLAFPH